MSLQPLVDNLDVYKLSPAEFRFLEACQHYALFRCYHGPAAGLKDNRFLWMCHADAFLMAIVSLQDLIRPAPEFYKNDAFRFLKVMRNITVHQAAVAAFSPLLMVNRTIAVQAGAYQPDKPDHEEPILVAGRIASALDTYKTQLRGTPKGIDKKTGLLKTMSVDSS